jgi:hypothetical protein
MEVFIVKLFPGLFYELYLMISPVLFHALPAPLFALFKTNTAIATFAV